MIQAPYYFNKSCFDVVLAEVVRLCPGRCLWTVPPDLGRERLWCMGAPADVETAQKLYPSLGDPSASRRSPCILLASRAEVQRCGAEAAGVADARSEATWWGAYFV
jgi:hypothetical protein